ncbi:MAG: hypothetical protein MJ072_06355, partial [Clostridia bacterium]|nr:hypothetical protein [Clostridia bacterium]
KAHNAPNGDDNHYTSGFTGTRQYQGTIADQLPKFDFSANVFKFEGVNNGKYTFVLEATSATRDIAMEVSCYTNAKSGSAGTNSKTYITVDGNGNLISTVYPYNISGIYLGYCTTTYSNIGTTDFATAFKHTKEEIFANYVPRPIKEKWDDYTMKYYSATHSTRDSHEEAASVALEAIFGTDAKDLPTPKALMSVFGDCLYGPFYDWKNIYEQDGETVKGYIDYFSVNTESPVFDENSQLSDEEFTKLIAKLDSALQAEGFTKDMANTDVSGGETGRSNRYVCYIKNEVQVVIENNHTKNIFMSFYKLGDWTLRK